MDTERFDRITRTVAKGVSRRGLVVAVGLLVIALPGWAEAKKRKRKRKNNQKVKRNEFGCVNVGNVCKNDDQCCSGICERKQGKKKCQAHDTQGCQADQDACVEGFGTGCAELSTAACFRTTGDASFCGFFEAGACMACTKDADCAAAAGPIAACVACPVCVASSTACIPGPA
jgi:hypothetical protein